MYNKFKRRLGVAALAVATGGVAAAALAVSSTVAASTKASARPTKVHAMRATACTKRGTLTFGIAGGDIPTIDPNIIASAAQEAVQPLLFDTLAKYTPNGTLVPDVATKWKASTDQKTWWFWLRRDVKYANGRPFTSADVVANVLRVLNPSVASQARGNIKDIRSVRAISKYEVRFKLGSPSSILPNQLFLTKMGDTTDPAKVGSGNGTGPYKVASFVPDQSLSLVPNPNYFGQQPCFNNITFTREPDPTSMVTAFTSGKLGMIWQIPVADVRTVQSDTNAYIVKPKSISSVQAWEVDTTSPPFNNVLARRALSYAIDRNTMVKVAFLGQATPSVANDLLSTTSPGYDKNLTPYTFNLTKAKQLFDQAGVKPGTTFTFWAEAGSNPEWITMGEILQQDLQKIGLNLKIVQSDVSTWLSKFYPAGKSYPATIVANFLSLQPNPTLGLSFATSGKCECNWNNASYDALLKKSFGIADPVKRQRVYDQMQQLLSQQAPVLAIAHQTNIVAAQKTITGVWEDPRGNVHLENARPAR